MNIAQQLSRVRVEDVPFVVKTLMPLIKDRRIVLLYGSLGAGKTTLVNQLAHELGIADEITSPTFSYVNKHLLSDGRVFYHFDLYRLLTPESFGELGFDEFLQQENALCCIEWPEIIERQYPQALKIHIGYESSATRRLDVRCER